jgi:hypothetical protein
MTKRETILQVLFASLQTIKGPHLLRNEPLPEKIPAGGLIILRDGDLGEPEVTLSPLSYYWNHNASAEVLVQHANAARRDAMLDDLFQKIAAAVAADETLGGLCDRATPFPPDISNLAIDGAPSIKAAIIPIELVYTTDSQLG